MREQESERQKKAFVYSILIHALLLFILWILAPREQDSIVVHVQLPSLQKKTKVLNQEKKQKKEKIKTNKKNITSKKEAGKEESAFEKFFKTATTKKGTKSKKQDDFSFAKSKITGKKAKIGFPIAGKTGNYQNLSEGDIKGKTGDGKLPSEIPGGRTGLGKTGKGSIAGRKIIFKPKIPYPLYYRKKGIFGKAIVWVEVSPSGKVLRTRLKQSTGYPDLDILAERGVAKMLFSPVRKQVNDTGEIVVRFKLKR